MKHWVIVIRGIHADDATVAEAAKRAREALQLTHTGTVTITEWMFDELTGQPAALHPQPGTGQPRPERLRPCDG